MCRILCVLGLLALYVGLAQSWDIAVSLKEQLVFYTDGTKTNTVNLISRNPTALVYDELHNMILYVEKQSNNDSICGYILTSKENKCFIKRNGRNIHGLAFDPVTETIFFTDTIEKSINFVSLKSGYKNNDYGNLLLKLHNRIPTSIAVDSCRGYILWTNKITKSNNKYLELARLNDSETQVLNTRKYYESFSLAVDLQTQKIFNFDINCAKCISPGEESAYITIADLNSESYNFEDIFRTDAVRNLPKVLIVSKDYIYFTMSNESVDSVWQFPKTARGEVKPKEIIQFYNKSTLGIIANYKIKDQIKGIQNCGSLSSLLPIMTVRLGDIGERSETSVCENYCLHGDCGFNDEGLPQCSCYAGYSGNRCEVHACHGYCLNNGTCSLNKKSEPVCQCKGQYVGDRCEVSPCLNYCMQGSCNFNDDGLPKCSCNAGYSGERCEVNACQGYCLNDGDCSLNEEDEPVCQCDVNHEGSKCEADINDTTHKYDAAKSNGTLAYLLSILRKASSKMYLTVEV